MLALQQTPPRHWIVAIAFALLVGAPSSQWVAAVPALTPSLAQRVDELPALFIADRDDDGHGDTVVIDRNDDGKADG